MSRTIAVHVRNNSWYISLPSSAKQQREMYLVTEALEWLRNKHDTVIHSYDPINDQGNAEIQLEFQGELSVDEVFNEQAPSEIAANA